MTRRRRFALALAVGAAAAVTGAAYHVWRGGDPRAATDAADAVDRLYAAQLADLRGTPQPLGQWRGRVLVVNFWATWCAPCREEIPGFVRFQERYRSQGVLFVGIALDQPDKVAEFAREFHINYPLLIGNAGTLDLLRRVGNRAGVLPYTLIIDRQGRLASRHAGAVKESRLSALVGPVL